MVAKKAVPDKPVSAPEGRSSRREAAAWEVPAAVQPVSLCNTSSPLCMQTRLQPQARDMTATYAEIALLERLYLDFRRWAFDQGENLHG